MENKKTAEFVDEVKTAFENLNAEEDMETMKAKAKEIADVATEFIQKYPIQSVVGAAVIGFALGALIKRK